MLLHLWQTSLVWAVLWLLGRSLRFAPARLVYFLWFIGLAKLFLPLQWVQLAVGPVWRGIASTFAGAPTPTSVPGASYITAVLTPGIWSGAGASAANPAEWPSAVATVLWLSGMLALVFYWTRRARFSALPRVSVGLDQGPTPVRARVQAALVGTAVPEDRIRLLADRGIPAVTGLLQPVILLPIPLVSVLPTEELRAVLLHEDAHRRRRDPLLAAIQRSALLVFFFYPPLWWLTRRLRVAAETACDESVLQHGVPSTTLGRALARALSLALLPTRQPATVGLGHPSGLAQRLSRLEHSGRYEMKPKHRWALVLASLVVALSVTAMPPGAANATEVVAPTYEPFLELNRVEYLDVEIMMNFEGVPLEKVFETLEATTRVDFEIEGQLPVTRKIDYPRMKARDALIRLSVDYGLMYDVVSRFIVRVRPIAVAGLDGVTNPTLITNTPPAFPVRAREEGVEGKVVLQVIVRADGTVDPHRVLRGVPDYPEFAESARSAIREWRYEPATRDDLPVDAFFTVFIEYSLGDRDPTSTAVQD